MFSILEGWRGENGDHLRLRQAHGVKDLGEDRPVLCERCHNQVGYRFLEIRRWFTLFFIPVIPFSREHALVCPICGLSYSLPKDAFDARRRDAGQAA